LNNDKITHLIPTGATRRRQKSYNYYTQQRGRNVGPSFSYYTPNRTPRYAHPVIGHSRFLLLLCGVVCKWAFNWESINAN